MDYLISTQILASHFKRSGLKIAFQNETSQTAFLKFDTITIKELKENGLSMDLPINACHRGHQLTLFFFDLNDSLPKENVTTAIFKEAKFAIVGKVESIQILTDRPNMANITVLFHQYDTKNWKQIISEFVDRQDKINELLAKQHLGNEEGQDE